MFTSCSLVTAEFVLLPLNVRKQPLKRNTGLHHLSSLESVRNSSTSRRRSRDREAEQRSRKRPIWSPCCRAPARFILQMRKLLNDHSTIYAESRLLTKWSSEQTSAGIFYLQSGGISCSCFPLVLMDRTPPAGQAVQSPPDSWHFKISFIRLLFSPNIFDHIYYIK